MADYTIGGLWERTYLGGTLRVRSVLTATDVFTRYYINYPSDELIITGIMHVPPGDGPFPVVILKHGYIPRDGFWSGADTVFLGANGTAGGFYDRQCLPGLDDVRLLLGFMS